MTKRGAMKHRQITKRHLKEIGTWSGGTTGVLGTASQIQTLPEIVSALPLELGALATGIVAISTLTTGFLLPLPQYPWQRDYLRPMRPDEIQDFFARLNEHAAGPLSEITRKYDMLRISTKSFYTLERETGGETPPHAVGYLVAYRLKKAAAELAQQGKKRGPDFQVRDLTKDRGRCDSIYIAFMWAIDRHAKASLIAETERLLTPMILGSRSKRLFSRPTTQIALRLVKRQKMRSIFNRKARLNEVCVGQY